MQDKTILYSRISIIALSITIITIIYGLDTYSMEKSSGLFGGLFNSTPNSSLFQIVLYLISAIILLLTGFYPRKLYLEQFSSIPKILNNKLIYYKTNILEMMDNKYKILEYGLIILFTITGASFLLSSNDLVSIFLSIELQSYGLYLICTIYRNSESATSGGLTYFLLGGLSSCFILLGQSLLYSNTSVTCLDGYYLISSMYEISYNTTNNFFSLENSNYLNISLLIISVGFLFKVSAAPFHFWSPDVYDAIPTLVTTFVAIIAKISILILLLELVHYISNDFFSLNFTWTNGLLVSSLLSLIIGSVLGLTQFRIKRLLAYSTISHIGFILLSLSMNTLESIQAFLFYLLQYSFTNLNAFIIVLIIGYSLYGFENTKYNYLKDMENSPIQLVSQLKGYFYHNPFISLSLAITIFSFVGVPPLIGFFAKQMILSSALDNGYYFLTIIAILTSVIGAVYYLSIIKQIYFDEFKYTLTDTYQDINLRATILENHRTNISKDTKESPEKINFSLKNIVISNCLTISISILTLIILVVILNPEILLRTTNLISLLIFNC
uniref:NADH-ubiquinone oxidoreductase chain 2 n=1 Tax=Pertusaria plittiana TaxID=394545 RepID=A0A2P1M527_9LECA|nr:NADH dehydrogenase subunit 2 [Pertusaria plittiana]